MASWGPGANDLGLGRANVNEQFRPQPRALGDYRPAARGAVQPVPAGYQPHQRDAGGLLGLHFRGQRGSRPRRGDPGAHGVRPTERWPHLPDLHAGRSVAGEAPDRQERAGDRQAGGQRRQPVAALPAVLVPDAAADRRLGVLHAPDAGGRRPGDGLRQVACAPADREAGPRHLRGRRRHRRGQGRAAGDRRVPQGPAEVPAPGRQDPQGLPAGRPARHRQDAAGPRHRGRGERAVLHHLGFRLRGDVRRRRRQPRARHVRAGQEERPLHHLHRRNRRGRPSPRRRPGRRQRRARADAEPDAGRDGRLRVATKASS